MASPPLSEVWRRIVFEPSARCVTRAGRRISTPRSPHRDSPTLTTQFYVEGEAQNDSDFLYRRVPEDRRQMVTSRFPESADETGQVIAEYTVVIG